MAELQDPNREAWEIVTKEGDPDHPMRNDGQRLQLAEDNIWYRLMTVGETQDEHRRYWNGWACQNLIHVDRVELAYKFGIDQNELRPLDSTEIKIIELRLGEDLPKVPKLFEMDKVHFEKYFIADQFYFPGSCDFSRSNFLENAYFDRALFSENVDFDDARFMSFIHFDDTQFSDSVSFERSYLRGGANFRNTLFYSLVIFEDTKFFGAANFESTEFSNRANFNGARFSQFASFESAQFYGKSTFDKTVFQGKTIFEGSNFLKYAPEFYGAEFHPDISLPTPEKPTDNWPKVPKIEGDDEQKKKIRSQIISQKNAYTELRRHMNSLHKVDEEQFFYRQEMACQRRLEKFPLSPGYYLYDQFSGYGWSILWPLLSLFALWLLGAAFYLNKFGNWGYAFMLSAASTIPAFGTRRDLLEAIPGLHPEYSVVWVSMLQTLFGLVFIFLLLLAIRNRFRLR